LTLELFKTGGSFYEAISRQSYAVLGIGAADRYQRGYTALLRTQSAVACRAPVLIRMHLEHIANAFQNGDFEIPMFVHDTTPPGVPEMKRLQKRIRFSFEATPDGGRVVIVTSDKGALTAIHRFLRFQIEEHRTGDDTSGVR
jgi:hypothetical protein